MQILFCTDIMNDIEYLIFSYMMQFIVRVMTEYATSCRPRHIRSVLNSSLQENVWLVEMLNQILLTGFTGC